jgi:diguanylate cyclase (GGDEF)-like protein
VEPLVQSAHVLRARRTAAITRAALSGVAIALVLGWPSLASHQRLSAAGFAFIIVTSAVQLLVPNERWLKIEESVAGIAGLLIVGLGDQRVNILTLLWLAAVATGVLARGGRVHWMGRNVLLTVLFLPIVLDQKVTPQQAGLIVGAIGLLLTCGRLTEELRDLLAQARHDADHDSLTGLLSRPAFHRRGAALDPDQRTALLLVDLDGFGHVNKLNGHATGDALLVSIASLMEAVLGPEAAIGRIGGDEFGALVRAPEPEAMAEQLVTALDERLNVRASAGVALAPLHGHSSESLLRAADVALRVAKRTGGRAVSTYAGEAFGESGTSGPRASLERLIAGEGLKIVVQPIVDVASRRPHAYEALARFHAGSTNSPLHWFALADEFGLRDDLELACLREALKLLPGCPAGTRLSVNLSGPVLLDPRVPALLEAQPDLSGLIVEITEEAIVEKDAGLDRASAALLAKGASLAIDDMGAGYSGLRQITALNPSYLKLDRALVQGIEPDGARAALVEALVGYAERTGSRLVAEGVETREELDVLAALGVPLIQGFYFGRPGAPWPELESHADVNASDTHLTNDLTLPGGVTTVAPR